MTEPLRLIALMGRAGAGKDSVAATLVRHLNYRSVAFADALRAEIAECWRIDPRMLQEPATKEWAIPALALGNCGDPQFIRYAAQQEFSLIEPRSPRWLMQRWGDFQRRRLGDGHYAGIVTRWIWRQAGTGWTRLVVTDLRFAIERDALCEFGARLRTVRVVRPGLPAHAGRHASEIEWLRMRADSVLLNTGTLEDLVSATLRMEARLWASAEDVRHASGERVYRRRAGGAA